MRDMSTPPSRDGDVVLGEDWVAPETASSSEMRDGRARRGLMSLGGSPLARKIITFNLIALNVLVAGILYLNSTRDSLAVQRISALVAQAELVADVIEAKLPSGTPVDLAAGDAIDMDATLAEMDVRERHDVFVFDTQTDLVAQARGTLVPLQPTTDGDDLALLTDSLSWVWNLVSSPFAAPPEDNPSVEDQLRPLVDRSLAGETQVSEGIDGAGGALFSVVTPIQLDGAAVGVVALTSASGEIDAMVRNERERVLQMFVIATLVSIGLSLVLASTIANPLADLAAAAELGRDKNARKVNPGRIRIPDLTARPDEIGRLSGALRGMIAALYNRIDGNEQFAADVAHEIKNPLAGITGAAQLLSMNLAQDDLELTDLIVAESRRIVKLLEQVEQFGNLSPPDLKPVNIHDVLDRARRSALLGFGAQMTIVEDYDPSLPLAYGDADQLLQVVLNLLKNASEAAGNAGGTIHLHSYFEHSFRLRRADGSGQSLPLQVEIIDDGPGLPDGIAADIFDPFVSGKENGTGLGLALVSKIISDHDGWISVTSVPGKTVFRLSLPRAPKSAHSDPTKED